MASTRFALTWTIVLSVLSLFQSPRAPAQTVSYSGSAQYSTGDYIFADRTHSVYLSNGLSLSTDRVDASISVPIIFQSSPWVSYSPVGGIPSGGPQQGAVGRGKGGNGQGGTAGIMGTARGDHGNRDRRGRQPGETIVLPDTASYTDVGVGDPSARLDVQVLQDGPSWLGLGLSASAKAPIADVDRGFGTGAWDAGLGVSLSKRLGSWFLFGDATYWWLGDMTDVALNNSIAYSASIGRVVADAKLGLLASLSGYTSEIIDNVEPPLQLGLGANYSMAQGKYSLNTSLTVGLVESSPDVSVGLGWNVNF